MSTTPLSHALQSQQSIMKALESMLVVDICCFTVNSADVVEQREVAKLGT